MDANREAQFMIEPPVLPDVEKTNGFLDANIFSKLLWCFPSGIISRASKRQLGPHDLHQIARQDKSENIHNQIMEEWHHQMKTTKRKNTTTIQKALHKAQKTKTPMDSIKVEMAYPSFLKSIMTTFGLIYIATGMALLVYSGSKIANVFLLRELVSHVRRKDTFDSQAAWIGLLFAIGMALCTVVQAMAHHFVFFFTTRIGIQVKGGVTATLYRKALSLTASALAKTSIGHAVNILSVDANQFEAASPFLVYIIYAPIDTIVGIYLVSRDVGITALFGAGVVLLMIIYQFYTSFKFASIRTLLVKFTDQRVKLLNEVLNADIVKMYAWEEPLLEKVMDERNRELKYISQNITFKGINMATFFTSVSLIHMVTFAGHVARGGELTSELVFSVMAYYDAIIFPIVQFFPYGIEKLSEVRIASNRIERFLMLGEDMYHKDEILHPNGSTSPQVPVVGVTPPHTVQATLTSPPNSVGSVEMTEMAATAERVRASTPTAVSTDIPPQVTALNQSPDTTGVPHGRDIRDYPIGTIRVSGTTFKWPDHSATVHTHTQQHMIEFTLNSNHEVTSAMEQLIETNKTAIKLQQKRDKEKYEKHIQLEKQRHLAKSGPSNAKHHNINPHKPTSHSDDDNEIANDRLENLQITISPGTLTCIVGGVGSGKSSLLLALMNEMPQMEPPTHGGHKRDSVNHNQLQVHITGNHNSHESHQPSALPQSADAISSCDLTAQECSTTAPKGSPVGLTSPFVHGTISYAPQRAWLLAASVRDNILFGTPFDKERYVDAVYSSALGRDFSLFPNGDAMYIAENGKSLSGGQRSRLCICKAIYRDADVYMFDDVLAAVDQVVAEHIFHNVMGPSGTLAGKTRVLVTHALAFLPFADQVIVMHEGRVVSVGTYDEVRATGWLDDDKMLTGGNATPHLHGKAQAGPGPGGLSLAIKPVDALNLDENDSERDEDDTTDANNEEDNALSNDQVSFSASTSILLAEGQSLTTVDKEERANVSNNTKRGTRKPLKKLRKKRPMEEQKVQQEPDLSPIASVGSPAPSPQESHKDEKRHHDSTMQTVCTSKSIQHGNLDPSDEYDSDYDGDYNSQDEDGLMNQASTHTRHVRGDYDASDNTSYSYSCEYNEDYQPSRSFIVTEKPEYSTVRLTRSMSLSMSEETAGLLEEPFFSVEQSRRQYTGVSTTTLSMGFSDEARSTQLTKQDVREIIENVDRDKASRDNIITVEKRSEGRVSGRTYRDFIIGDYLPMFLLVVIALLAPAALRLWADITLSDWAAQSYTKQQNEDYTRNLFLIVSGCTVIIALFRALLCMRHLLHSSAVFFEKQLYGVMFSPLSFFQSNPTGRILNRLSKDQFITDELLPVTVFDFFEVTMMVISTFCIMGIVAPYILLTLVVILPLFYYLRRRYARASRDVQRIESTSRSPIFTHFTTSMTGLAVIRAFRMEKPFIDVFHHYVDLNTRALLEFHAVSRWLGFRLDVASACITLLAGVFAVYVDIKPSMAGLILTYVSTLGSVLQWSVRQSTMVENQFAAVERILEYAYLPPEESVAEEQVKKLDKIDEYTQDMLTGRDDVVKKGRYARVGAQQEFDMSPDDYIYHDYKGVGHLITGQEDIAKILKDGLSSTLQLIDETNAKVEVLRKLIQRDEERQLSDAKGSTQKKSSSGCCGGDPSTAASEQPPSEAQDVEYDIETNYAEYANLSYEEKTSQLKAELHTLHTLQPECLSAPPAPLDHASDAPLHSSTVKRILYHPPANWPHAGAISFQSVVLTYRDGLAPVLKGLSFDITPGMKVGICGRTGAGKSSAIGVLYRLFPICYGRVMVDGIDISHVPLHTLRSMLAIIPQSPFIFSDTIRYNLDPFDEHTDEDIYRVLKKVRLFSLVNSFPDKLNTLMSESGANISQGQCQLLCIGRALLKQSKVLLVDEATANIDPASDAIIQRVLQTEFHDRTVITIAHRLQTIMHCDMIMLLDSGNVMETGSPQELLALNGVFASMYEAQKQQEDDLQN